MNRGFGRAAVADAPAHATALTICVENLIRRARPSIRLPRPAWIASLSINGAGGQGKQAGVPPTCGSLMDKVLR